MQIDDSAFPLVVSVCPRTGDAKDVDDYFARLEAVAARGRFALLVDLRPFDAETVTPKLRKRFAEKTNAWDEQHPRALLAEAVVLGSPVHQLLFTAYQWMRRSNAYESRAFGSVKDARAWLETVVAKSVAKAAGNGPKPGSGPR